jgi:hypothetical protein
MKNLWFVSIIFVLVAGCISIKPSHTNRQSSIINRQSSTVVSYTTPVVSHLFKATLDIKKHHLTGLLVIKRMETPPPAPAPPQEGRGETPPPAPPPAPPQEGRGEDSSGIYRIVFMNEIGMTFFDLELSADSLKVVSCFESLNKKALMKIFETDFRVLNWSGLVQNEQVYLQKETNNMIVKGRIGKYKTWQTYSPSGDTLCTIAAKSSIADPVIISFVQYNDGFPGKITIENPFIGMKLALRKLSK